MSWDEPDSYWDMPPDDDDLDGPSYIPNPGYRSRKRDEYADLPEGIWKTADGEEMEISDMTHVHLVSTIQCLEKTAVSIPTSTIKLVRSPKYVELVREAIKRNLLQNPYNGVDVNMTNDKMAQTKGKVDQHVIRKGDRKVDFDL